MCLGPHEMSRERLQQHVEQYREYVADPAWSSYRDYYSEQLTRYEQMLKNIDNGDLVWDDDYQEWVKKEKEEAGASR